MFLFSGAGSVTNLAAGMISGELGINAKGATAVTNAGTINGTGTYSVGVLLQNGGTVDNQSGATISGGQSGVQLQGGASLTNSNGGRSAAESAFLQ